MSEGEISEMGPIIGSFLSDVNMPKQLRDINQSITPGLAKETRPMKTCCGFNPIQNSHQDPRELRAQVKRPSRAVPTLTSPIPKAHWMIPDQQMDLQAVGQGLELH